MLMEWRYLGVLLVGLCFTPSVVWGQGYAIDDDLTPFNITVDGQHCVTVNSTQTNNRNISVTCSSLLYGQRVRLTRIDTSYTFLFLCEFEILACTPGFYGDNCDQTCRSSKCLDNTCHPDTGLCMECAGNFNGPTCSECKAGYYRSCDSCYPCSSLCAIYHCHPSNGSCIACVTGRWGERCQHSCSETCVNSTCHRDTGVCTECNDGFSKHNSSTCSSCSASCKAGNCHGDTGDCTQGCQDGRHGATCNTTCSPAGCQTCHQHSGNCTACKPLYNLDPTSQCKEAQGETTTQQAVCESDTDKLIVPVIGSIVGVGLLLAISLTAAVCWINRRRKHSEFMDKEENYYSTPDPVLMLSNTERGLPELPSPSPSSGNREHTEPKTMHTDITDDDYTHPKTMHTGNTGNTGNEYTHPKTIHTGNTGNDYTHLKTIHTGNTDDDYTRPLAVQTINTDEKNTKINTDRTESPDRQGTQPKTSWTQDAGKQGTEDTAEDHIYTSMDTEETTL